MQRLLFLEDMRYLLKKQVLCATMTVKNQYIKAGEVSILNQSKFKREALIQKIKAFRLLDDDFMSKVFEDDIECTEFFVAYYNG